MDFSTLKPQTQVALPSPPFLTWNLPSGERWAEFYRDQSDYLIRFPKYADYWVSADGLEVRVSPSLSVDEETLKHLYLNQVLPLALSRQLKLILHASAVCIGGKAVAFLGASGAGKSTLAVSFALDGNGFLTDDGLELKRKDESVEVQPSNPSVRLWEDSEQELIPESVERSGPVQFSEKMRLLADDKIHFEQQPAPLKKLYLLLDKDVNEVEISPLSGHGAMMELVKNSFLLDVDARDMLQHHFSEIAHIMEQVPIFSLAYPHDYQLLPTVRAAIREHLG